MLFDAGFERGTASPVVFWHEGRSMWCVVHGDDFSFVGYDSDLDFIVKVLQNEYEIKVREIRARISRCQRDRHSRADLAV